MPRVAVGDLLMDLELPPRFRCSYEESGALLAVDTSDRFALRISGITVRGKTPTDRNLCIKSVSEAAGKLGLPIQTVADSLIFYRDSKQAHWDDGPGVNEFWFVGWGNRELVVTLSYLESDRLHLDLGDLRGTAEEAIRSVRLTFPERPRDGDKPDIFDLAASQRLWLDHHRSDMARRVRKLTGYDGDGPIPLTVLDDFWSRFIAAPPSNNNAVNAILNGVGVVLGDHLVQAKSFEWAIVSDSYGVCLAVVALRGTSNINTDPFNFVTKRWERKESKFLADGFRAICRFADDAAAKAGEKF